MPILDNSDTPPRALNAEERAELDKLCAMLDFVELSLAKRFGQAPAGAVSIAQEAVRAHFKSSLNEKTHKASWTSS